MGPKKGGRAPSGKKLEDNAGKNARKTALKEQKNGVKRRTEEK